MYDLHLMDGTIIKNLSRLNPCTFELKSTNPQIYFILSEVNNLTIAYLEKDGLLDDIYVDYGLQNFSAQNDIIKFRIGIWDTIYQEKKKKKKRRGGK